MTGPAFIPEGLPALRRTVSSIASVAALAALTACTPSQEKEKDAVTAKPVTTMALAKRTVEHSRIVTGSVSLYRSQALGFDVRGRLAAVRELGDEAAGPVEAADGRVIRKGGVLAQLDDGRYRLRVQALEARLRALEKERAAQTIDIEKVGTARLAEARAARSGAEINVKAAQAEIDVAQAEKRRARAELERQQKLRASASGRQKQLDEAQAAFDTAEARLVRQQAVTQTRRQALEKSKAALSVAEAAIELKRAEREATLAKIAAQQARLGEARRNLADTVLRAPFDGRVTAIHANKGAVLDAGAPVVTFSLQDPIQVEVNVSADDDRRIRTGDKAKIFPKDPLQPSGQRLRREALIFEKSGVADPRTRTFRITLMARNERITVEDLVPGTKGLPKSEGFLAAAKRFKGEPGPLFVPTESIYMEDGAAHVLRLPGIGFNDAGDRSSIGRHVPEKIRITLGDDYMTVIKWRFRSISDDGGLKEGDFLLINPRSEHLAGVAVGRSQWLLRPGDLVPVQFTRGPAHLGFYVPAEAVTEIGKQRVVFTVADGKAKSIAVKTGTTADDLVLIEAKGLTEGMPIILGGLHYVGEGDPVSVISQESFPE